MISKSVMEQLDSVELSNIKIDVSAPYLKHMLATSFAKALSEVPSEKVIACWAPLQEAWDNKEALHADAKKELIRLFPNHSGRPLPTCCPLPASLLPFQPCPPRPHISLSPTTLHPTTVDVGPLESEEDPDPVITTEGGDDFDSVNNSESADHQRFAGMAASRAASFPSFFLPSFLP